MLILLRVHVYKCTKCSTCTIQIFYYTGSAPHKNIVLLLLLSNMVVTFPTCHVERSPLKAPAASNTVHHSSNKEKSNDKNGLKKKEERALFKNRISAAMHMHRKKKWKIEEKTRSWRVVERGGRVYMYVLDPMCTTFPTCHLDRSPLKAPAPSNTAPQQ